MLARRARQQLVSHKNVNMDATKTGIPEEISATSLACSSRMYIQVQNTHVSLSHEPGVRGRQRRNGTPPQDAGGGLAGDLRPCPRPWLALFPARVCKYNRAWNLTLVQNFSFFALPQLGPGHWTAASDCYPLHPCSDPSPQEPRHTPSHGCSSIQIAEMMSRQSSMSVNAKHTVSAAAGGSWLAARASSNSTLFTAWPVAAEPPSVRPDDTPADTTRGLMWLSGAAHDVCPPRLLLSSPT